MTPYILPRLSSAVKRYAFNEAADAVDYVASELHDSGVSLGAAYLVVEALLTDALDTSSQSHVEARKVQ